jgi:hypothetical protein
MPLNRMSATALVAALRHPGRAEVAAAEMHGDGHAGRAAGAGGVDQVGVDVQQPVGIVAAVAQHLALVVVAQIGDVHLVELQVGAARLAERRAPPCRSALPRSAKNGSISG